MKRLRFGPREPSTGREIPTRRLLDRARDALTQPTGCRGCDAARRVAIGAIGGAARAIRRIAS